MSPRYYNHGVTNDKSEKGMPVMTPRTTRCTSRV